MATYSLEVLSLANANDKNLLAINNATGSGKLIKIYRIWVINNGTGTVSGGMTGILLGRMAAVSSGGTAINFQPHSSCVTANSATPFTGISAVSGATTITGTIATELRRVFKATDELTAASGTMEEIQLVRPWAVIWDTGYADSNVEPLVIRENQGILLRTDSAPANTVGQFSINVELDIV
jgi:hypothetical protein